MLKHNISKRMFVWAEGVALGTRGGSIPDGMKSSIDGRELKALEAGLSTGEKLQVDQKTEVILTEWAEITCPLCLQTRLMPFAPTTTCPHCDIEMIVMETHLTTGPRIIGGVKPPKI